MSLNGNSNGNDICVSGMSGRFPLSDTTDEFAKNLFSGVDMVTDDDSRWPLGMFDMSNRMGKIQNYQSFDNGFFGLPNDMLEELDPQSRLLLEVSYESMLDSGVNPQSLRGSNTGVYVGLTIYKNCDGFPDDVHPDVDGSLQTTIFQTLFEAKNLYASRISFVNDLKGPTFMVDTACSSSLSAMTLAYNDLLLDNTDAAIVCGTHMVFEPFINQFQQELGLCSPRGVSAVFDESADGYVKSEAVCCLFLQRRRKARRVYAQVVSARVNVDGYKKMGMFFPSAESQAELMRKTCKAAKVDPTQVTYVETHGTGTKVGDPQEVKAIYNAYCEGRTEPLPLGALKSNMGHPEGSSGVSALVKVLIAYENECLAAVNNFGIGGANAHVLLEPNHKLGTSDGFLIAETIPRIVNICGRTEDAVKYVMDFIQNNPKGVTNDFLALLAQTMKYTPNVNSSGMPFRGSLILKKVSEENNEINYEYKRQMGVMKGKSARPLWLLFPGLGGQWPAMAAALMPIKIFADKVEECHQILHEFGVDLKHMLLSEDKTSMSTMTAKFCSTTAIEIALFEVMKALDITPDDKLKDLPTDAIILELGPHSIFPKVVSETLDNSTYVSLIKRNANDTNLETFMAGLATLYESGVNLSIEKLYPVVEWPVARNTQSISSLMRWDHSRKFEHRLYPQKYCRLTAGDYNFTVDASMHQSHAFYLDHAVDGNVLFPATGYLMLAWRKLAVSRGKAWYQLPVIFENVQLKRAVFLNDVNKTNLRVKYFPNTDEFCVLENDNVCVVGKVRTPDDEVLLTPNAILERQKLMAST
ncbi:unnamed protein product, partial [Medioppia subpectinata]